VAVVEQIMEAKLTIGDPAPKLQAARWVQGEPVGEFKPGTVYIVEFWATWCGPCRNSIPHLNELWLKFKDRSVVVIGQDVWEQNEDGVEAFVKKMGDQMTYRVAFDDRSQTKPEPGKPPGGFMADHWMKAAEQRGIPTAFVINRQGRIAWIGHPMGLNEKILADILADQFDLAAFAQEYEKHHQEEKQLHGLYKKLHQANREKNWDAASATLDEIIQVAPTQQDGYAWLRLLILFGQKKYDDAYQFAEAFSDHHLTDACRQNLLAWVMATQESIEPRTLALAEKIAGRANKAANSKDPYILDTLARIQFRNGKTSEAVATEQKAVELAPDEEKSRYRKFLVDYQQGKLPEIKHQP
jgi:thiol-disulfide isomerase/thioredoxin